MMASQVDEMDHSALQAIVKGNMLFTINLFKILSEKEGNLFFSPLSIEVILALTYTGAEGKTAEQLAEALQLPKEKAILEKGFHSLMQSLKSTGDTTLEMANKIVGQAKFPFEASFKEVAEMVFLSAAEEMDFEAQPEECRQIINHWVEQRTHKKITNLIPAGLINSSTRLVLVNAIYFKGKWKLQFDPKMTRREPFYVTSTEIVEVQMMHIKKKFGYFRRDEIRSTILSIPYMGDKIVMVILLPYEMDGLKNLENNIHKVDMEDILNSLDFVEVEVSLPRFKFETATELNEPLKKLGMIDMFNEDSANFSGLTKFPGIHVSNVLQKAFLEVNEKGTKAVAATSAMNKLICRPPQPKVFQVDHPFLFALVHHETKMVIFLGRVSTSSCFDYSSDNSLWSKIRKHFHL